MPLTLIHEAFAKHAIFQRSDEVSVPLSRPSATASSSLIIRIRIDVSVWRRRVVSRARLQPDGGVRIQMACDALNGRRDASALMVHRGCTLAAGPCSCLRIEILRGSVLRLRHLPLHHAHLGAVARRLRGVGRRCGLLVARVQAIVHWRRLAM